MNILMVSTEMPLHTTGGLKKLADILYGLSGRHCCDLAAYCELGISCTVVEGVKTAFPHVRNVFSLQKRSGWTLKLLQLGRFLRGELPCLARYDHAIGRERLSEIVREHRYDVVILDLIGLAEVLPLVRHIPTVWSLNDPASLAYEVQSRSARDLWSRLYFHRLVGLARSLEKRYAKMAAAVHLVSRGEADVFFGVNPEATVACIRLAGQRGSGGAGRGVTARNECEFDLLLLGNCAFQHIWSGALAFLSKPLAEIRKCVGVTRVAVLGGHETPGRRREIVRRSGASYVEWVSDYIGFLSKAKLVVVPDTSGTGLKNRVIDVLGFGGCLVATDHAARELGIVDGLHGRVFCHPGEISAIATHLLLHEDTRTGMVKNARRLYGECFSVQSVTDKWEQFLWDVSDHRVKPGVRTY